METSLKKSRYNIYVFDSDNNLFIYNFLEGLRSLTKIERNDYTLLSFIFDNEIIIPTEYPNYRVVFSELLRLGIMIPTDVDETVSFEASHYEDVYSAKLFLTILPTGNCFFKCPYCYEETQAFCRESISEENKKALLKFIQQNISKYTGLRISWYGGEPLLEYNTIVELSKKFIALCKSRHLPYAAEMVTNGYLLTQEVFDTLYNMNVYTYMVTFDGFREQHNRIRHLSDGRGSFDVIMTNLLRIRDCKKYKFAKVIIRVNVSQEVLPNLDEFLNYLNGLFSNDSRFKITFASVIPFTEESNKLYNGFVNSDEMYNKLFVSEKYMEKLYTEEQKIGSLIPENKCYAARKNSYLITSDLSVYKCDSFFEDNLNMIGNITANGKMNIAEWKHKYWYYDNKYVRNMSDECRQCFYMPCCRLANPGCPVRYRKEKELGCPMKEVGFKNGLEQGVLYVMEHYPCTVLNSCYHESD